MKEGILFRYLQGICKKTGGEVTMLFHAFRVVYTVKELDSHVKHRQSLNKQFGHIAEYFCAKNLTSGFVQVSESFFSCWHKRWWNSLFGHFSRKNAPVHALTNARARACPSLTAMLHGTRSGRMSLKKCVFGCEGKITLFSFPKNPVLREPWMQFVFPGQQQSFSSVFSLVSFNLKFDMTGYCSTKPWNVSNILQDNHYLV